MTIREVEEQTGLARSNIRFYENERLLQPSRNDKNGYRDYSEQDVEDIKKIAYLRTLDISVEDIRYIIAGKVSLMEVIEKQNEMLQKQLEGLSKAKIMCERMLGAGDVSFLYIWSSLVTWVIIASLCLIIGIVSYAKLPPEIPVQWSEGAATSLVDRKFIFSYPLVCIVIRLFLRPVLYVKLASRNIYGNMYGELIAEYLSNYICFIALSAEVFSILFVYDLVNSILVVLAVNTAVLIGLLAAGMIKMGFVF